MIFTTKYHKMIKRGENIMLKHIYKHVIKKYINEWRRKYENK